MKRIGNGADYAVEMFRTDLSNVAVKTKSLPAEYINEAGNNINDSYRDYVLPLVGELPVIGYVR